MPTIGDRPPLTILPDRTPRQDAPAAEETVLETVVHGLHDKAVHLMRYGSVIPILGGVLEAKYGLQQMRQAETPAQRHDGVVDVVRGGSAMVGSTANLPIYASGVISAAAAIPGPVMTALGIVGGVANTVNTLFDGGRDVVNGIRQHKPSDIGYGLVKLAGGTLLALGSFTVSIPLLIAGNVFFLGAAALQNRGAIGNALNHLFHRHPEGQA